MYSLFIRMTARPDSVDALFDAISAITPTTRRENGCVVFEPFRPVDGSPSVMIFEKWTDRALGDAHMAQAHMTDLMPKLGDWLVGQPEIVEIVTVEG